MNILQVGTPTGTAPIIQVVPVSERINKFLNDVFSTELSSADRRKLRSQHTLPQNELTKIAVPGHYDG